MAKLMEIGEVVMGQSPSGETYNLEGRGLPLLNGPTEFGVTHPTPILFTTDSKRESKAGDLIFCVRGSTTGRMNWSDQVYSLGRGVCSIRGGSELATKYIRYAIDNQLKRLLQLAGGGTFPNLKKDDILNFEIPFPENYSRIASILSAYDDLIENNLKRIKLLEEAAQHIYREWFVNFRFPGHERVRRGADGLPEGWRRVAFSEVVQISPPTPIIKDDPAPYVPMASLSESMMIITDVETRIPSGGARFRNGDTLFARITPCLENGKTAFVQFLDGEQTATGSTEFIVFRETSSVNQFFIYCVSREYSFRQHAIKSMTGSDGRQRVKPEAFDSYFIPVPPTAVMDQFFTVAAPLFKQVQVLANSNDRLKEARDILLPRLMNRTIEV